MGNKLVIAEKPMLGRDIARAICGKTVSENASLPITGNGYTVVACAGHLLELEEPADIDKKWGKPWREEALPVIVEDWPKIPASGKEKLIEQIADLLGKCSSVINAGDPDDEGQLIIDEVLDYLGYSGPVERVFVNDNIEKNIRRAFNELEDNSQHRAAGEAAYARQMADMSFGVSESRLATMRLGSMCNVGRVQTPTLGLVVRRDEQIEHHIIQTYYEGHAIGNTANFSGVDFKNKPTESLLAGEKHLLDISALKNEQNALEGTSVPYTTKVTKKKKIAPLPYNLTVLLADMSRRYKYTAAETQQITQDLRDKYKAITYNRSDCQYLKSEHHAQAPATLAQAMKNIGVHWDLDYSLKSKAFNDGNITAHHGIIPQDISVDCKKMTAKELAVYTAIVERYAMQFMLPAVYDVSTATFETMAGTYTHTCRKLVSAGWLEQFGKTVEPDEDENETKDAFLPEGNGVLHINEYRIVEKKTSPPKPYTEGTLITDMASIAKYVTDPEICEILKKKDDGKKGEHGGIGTTATRSNIIEKLKKYGFIEEKSGKVRSTQRGRKFYSVLPESIKSADTTARWWLIQQDIADGIADRNAIQRSVAKIFEAHRANAYNGASLNSDRKTAGQCPICGENIVNAGKTWTCASNKYRKDDDGSWKQIAGCGFKILPFCGKQLTVKQAANLLNGKKVPLKGCVSKKTGRKFDCALILEGSEVKPVFESKPKKDK